MGNQIFSCVGDENDSSTKMLERALAKDTQLNCDIKRTRANKRTGLSQGNLLSLEGLNSPKDIIKLNSPPNGVKIESVTLKRSPKNKN